MSKTIKNQILSRIYGHGRGWAFSPKDFVSEFDRSAIGVALFSLENEKKIRRIWRGIYDYPLFSNVLKRQVAPDMNHVAHALARKFNWRIYPAGDTALNYLGLSTQMVAHYVYLSDGPSKKYAIRNRNLEFKHTTLKETSLKYTNTVLVIQAIKAYGEKQITNEFVQQLSNKFSPDDWQRIKSDAAKAPVWVYKIITRAVDISKKRNVDG